MSNYTVWNLRGTSGFERGKYQFEKINKKKERKKESRAVWTGGLGGL
jgi:hypothetical protein